MKGLMFQDKREGLTFIEGQQYGDPGITDNVLIRPMDKSFGQFYYNGQPISAFEAFEKDKRKARVLTGQGMVGLVSDIDANFIEPVQEYIRAKIHKISQAIAELNGM